MNKRGGIQRKAAPLAAARHGAPQGHAGQAAGRRAPKKEERFHALLEHLPVGVYRTTPDGRIIEANRALTDILGAARTSDLFKVNVKDLYVKSKDRADHLRRLERKSTVFTEFELRRLDGRKVWVRDHPRAVKDARDRIIYFDGIIVDVTARMKTEKQLQKALIELERANQKYLSQSLSDELTGLHNRRGFFTLAQQLLKIARRVRNSICLVFMDVDDLKLINDTWGHKEGDRALIEFSRILRETFRESDVIGRVGGDEFAVLVLLPTRHQGRALLDRLQDKLEAFNRPQKYKFPLSASLGVVWSGPDRARSLENLLAVADRRMYWQKRRRADLVMISSTAQA